MLISPSHLKYPLRSSPYQLCYRVALSPNSLHLFTFYFSVMARDPFAVDLAQNALRQCHFN